MANLDKQKEIVTFWRTGFYLLVGVLFTLFGFLFNNFDKLDEFRLTLINIVMFLTIFILIGISLKLRKETDKLKDL